jgi:hypothetical protein
MNKREQIVQQCVAVRHMARTIADIYGDMAILFAEGRAEKISEIVGSESAALLETLGDILNGMDAVTEDDEWIDPIIEEAQRVWPTKDCES